MEMTTADGREWGKVFPLIGNEPFHQRASDASLAAFQRRFSHSVEEKPQLAFEYSRDPALLHQYYMLRAKVYTQLWHLEHFNGDEDEVDAASDILLIRYGKLCVGGARITVSSPDAPQLLPAEDDQFRLYKLLPELHLRDCTYTECGRFAVLPDFQDRQVSQNMLHHLILRSRAHGAKYLFWIAPTVQTRYYRQLAGNLHVPCTVRSDVKVPERPEYEGITMYLSVLDISSVPVNNEHKAQKSEAVAEPA